MWHAERLAVHSRVLRCRLDSCRQANNSKLLPLMLLIPAYWSTQVLLNHAKLTNSISTTIMHVQPVLVEIPLCCNALSSHTELQKAGPLFRGSKLDEWQQYWLVFDGFWSPCFHTASIFTTVGVVCSYASSSSLRVIIIETLALSRDGKTRNVFYLNRWAGFPNRVVLYSDSCGYL